MVRRYIVAAEQLDNGDWVKYEDYVKMRNDRDYWYEKCLDAGLLDNEEDKQ